MTYFQTYFLIIFDSFRFCIFKSIFTLLLYCCKTDEFSTTGNANLRGTLCFALVCSLMLISYVFTLILLISNCCSKRKAIPNKLNDVVPKANENEYNIKRTIDFKDESAIQESSNIDFVRKSEIQNENFHNTELFEVQSKVKSQNLEEESKLDFLKTFRYSPRFVNLKNEHTQGIFVKMRTKQSHSVSLFSKAGDITKFNINSNSREANSKPLINFSTFRRTKAFDEEC